MWKLLVLQQGPEETDATQKPAEPPPPEEVPPEPEKAEYVLSSISFIIKSFK